MRKRSPRNSSPMCCAVLFMRTLDLSLMRSIFRCFLCVCVCLCVCAWVKQLSEIGFGEDFDRIYEVLKAHKMNVSAAAEALIAED